MTQSILLFDDDCGICTKVSSFISRLIGVPKIPMSDTRITELGVEALGFDMYWKSFHIYTNGNFSTEEGAILELAGLFPFGGIVKRVASFPPILSLLMRFLRTAQRIRKEECAIEL